MKYIFSIVCFFILGGLLSCASRDNDLKVTEYVNPLVGMLHNTPCSPEACLPFGGVRFAPCTAGDTLLSFSFYNANSSCMQGVPDIRILPVDDKPATGISPQAFRDANCPQYTREQARPGYYGITLNSGIKTEAAVTERCAIMYYQYPTDTPHALLLDFTAAATADSVKTGIWKVSNRMLEGYCKSLDERHPRQTYFVIEFSQDCHILAGKDAFMPLENGERFTANGCYAWVGFKENTDKILVKASLSSANIEGASSNLSKELSHWSFDKVERDAKQTWKKELQKIKVEGGSPEQQRTFYTSLYYALLTPSVSSDVNGNYDGPDGEIHSSPQHPHYSVCPPWRELQDIPPILALTQKKRVREILKSSQNDTRYAEVPEEDNRRDIAAIHGQYVLSAIGFHANATTDDHLQLGTPAFDRIVIRTAPDKRFVITTEKDTESHGCVEEIRLNKQPLERSWLSLEEIMKGGKLNFILTNK